MAASDKVRPPAKVRVQLIASPLDGDTVIGPPVVVMETDMELEGLQVIVQNRLEKK